MEEQRGKEEMEKYRRRYMAPTSRKDIKHMLDGKVTVIEYTDLERYGTIEELLAPYMNVVILYPNPPPDNEVGHWCCLFTNTGTDRLEFFDSYGCYIDDKIGEYDEGVDRMHAPHKIEPKLLELIINSKYANNMHYNDVEYQSNHIATSTCGLWCVLRLKNKHHNEEWFEETYQKIPVASGILPDLLVAKMICEMYPEMSV